MQKQINFANLAPGEYRLQLKASFNNRWDGNEPVTTIHIEVEPPFLAFNGHVLLLFW